MKNILVKSLSFRLGRITLAEWDGKSFRLKILFPVGGEESATANLADVHFEEVQKLFFPVRLPSSEIFEVKFSNEETGKWVVEFYFEPGGMASRIECARGNLLSSTEEGKWGPAKIPTSRHISFGTPP